MQAPLEVVFRDVEKTPDLQQLVEEKAQRLERMCSSLVSCHVAVEKPQEHQESGNPYRVRIDMRVPPNHELVVKSKPRENPMHDSVSTVITKTFKVAERQLRDLKEKLRGDVKTHPEQQTAALVTRLFKDKGYGFIKATDGTEYYFHQNSVLHEHFDRLEPGTGVRFVGEMGRDGPQASTVEIVEKPDGATGR